MKYYEELLEKAPIEMVAYKLGLSLKKVGQFLMGNCPSGHTSVHEQCFVITPSLGLFHCFHCGVAGNAIQLVELVNFKSITKKATSENHKLARNMLADLIGMPHLNEKDGIEEEKIRFEKMRISNILKDAFQFYHSQMRVDQYNFLLNNYGITEETAKQLLIGYAKGDLFSYLKAKRYIDEEILSSGLFVKSSNKIYPFYQDRYVFPYWKHGEIVYSIGRKTEKTPENIYEQGKYKKHPIRDESKPYISPVICNDSFYYEDVIYTANEYIIITEGITDCILANQLGFKCISPATVRIKQNEMNKLIRITKHIKTIYICNDNEENQSGKTGAWETALMLEQNGKDVRIIELPRDPNVPKVDLNDFLRSRPSSDFEQLMRSAQSTIIVSINNLSKIDKNDVRTLGQEVDTLLTRISFLPKSQHSLLLKKIKNTLSGLVDSTELKVRFDNIIKNKINIEILDVKNKEYHLSDLGNSQRFSDKYHHVIKYSEKWGKFLIWNGKRWEIDELRKIYGYIKESIASIYDDAKTCLDFEQKTKLVKFALKSESVRSINAICELIKSDEKIATEHTKFDADKWSFNVLNGTINLKTLTLEEHKKEKMITKIAPIEYDENAVPYLWNEFLEEIMVANRDLIDFLQKMVGYSLTGDTREQCFFILYGSGQNGKSTFLNIIRKMMGDYAKQVNASTFMEQSKETIRNDLAALCGSRFVSAIEISEKEKIEEGLVKKITGQDMIQARFLYKEYFEYEPEFKICLAVNHKPKIIGTDDAIWRRIHLIPFTYKIPNNKKDKTLGEKLIKELPGILNWALEGLQKWLKEGLNPPRDITTATTDYRIEQDIIQNFILDKCIVAHYCKTQVKDLYSAFKEWCNENHEFLISAKKFNAKLLEKNFKKSVGTNNKTFWEGIGLINP